MALSKSNLSVCDITKLYTQPPMLVMSNLKLNWLCYLKQVVCPVTIVNQVKLYDDCLFETPTENFIVS